MSTLYCILMYKVIIKKLLHNIACSLCKKGNDDLLEDKYVYTLNYILSN